MELEKRYVPVTVHFDAGGKMRPIEIEFDESRKYHIDKILDVRRAACQSVGGVGDRYTCRIRGQESYDTHLYKLCDKAGIKRFCMHALRHTYVTRAIEYGMPPKTLQKLLGHASIKTTMDRYVHVTEDFMLNAVQLFEAKGKAG